MATAFSRSRGGITADLEPAEVRLLDTLFADVATLLADPQPGSDDPLAVELGLADLGIAAEAQLPGDPALARLLPDATTGDPRAAAEFRRYTERGLRRSKLAGLTAVRATLARPGGDGGRRRRLGAAEAPLHLRLDDDAARAWVVALTDLRLVLADRLGVRTEQDAEALHAAADGDDDEGPGSPGQWLALVYDFVTWLQESLAAVLLADLPAEGDGRRPPPPGLEPV